MKPLYNGMLPPSMIRRLADLWPEAQHVVTTYGEKFSDGEVWEEARANGYVIITKDSDFADEQKHPGPPPRAVGLLLGNSNPAELEAYLREHADRWGTLRKAAGNRWWNP